MELLIDVFNEQAERTHWLERKFPWYEILWNWTLALLLVVLMVATIIYGIQKTIDNKAEEKTATAMAELSATWQADADAEEQRKKEEYERMIDLQSNAVAQMLFGSRNFQTLYSYTVKDLETYVQSAFNRADAREQDLVDVIFQEGQYIACSRHNDITAEYKELARRLVEAWHNGELKCDTAFQYAELTPYGIFLRKSYGDERWHS